MFMPVDKGCGDGWASVGSRSSHRFGFANFKNVNLLHFLNLEFSFEMLYYNCPSGVYQKVGVSVRIVWSIRVQKGKKE